MTDERLSDILERLARLDQGQLHIIERLNESFKVHDRFDDVIYGTGSQSGLLTRVARLEQEVTDYAARMAPWRLLLVTLVASIAGALITVLVLKHVS